MTEKKRRVWKTELAFDSYEAVQGSRRDEEESKGAMNIHLVEKWEAAN